MSVNLLNSGSSLTASFLPDDDVDDNRWYRRVAAAEIEGKRFINQVQGTNAVHVGLTLHCRRTLVDIIKVCTTIVERLIITVRVTVDFLPVPRFAGCEVLPDFCNKKFRAFEC